MGNRLTGEEDPQQTETPYGDIFDELFPHYLMMGMTPEQYWDGESSLKPAFRKAYQLKIETEQRLADRQNWLMGQYLVFALNATPLLVAGLNVKKGAQLPEYPDKPFLEKMEEQKKEEVRKKNEEDQTMMALAMFQSFVKNANKNIEKKPKPTSTGQ